MTPVTCGVPSVRLDPAERARMLAEVERADEARLLASLRAQVEARIPERFRARPVAALLTAIRAPEFRRVAERWRYGHPGCVLSGPSRVGKTTAAAVVLRRLLATDDPRWRSLRWVTPLRLVRARQDARSNPDGADPQTLLERASAVILDDLGQEPATDLGREVVHELLEARYGRGLPTIATTELTRAQLLDRYGAATLARILESGGRDGKVVEVAP